jgi:hypothetical protein
VFLSFETRPIDPIRAPLYLTYSNSSPMAVARAAGSQVTMDPQSPAETDEVTPLAKGVFESMPRTMRNLTVYGKTIIITG